MLALSLQNRQQLKKYGAPTRVNTKQRQREALTKERQHRLATGGGPSISDAVVDPDVSMVAPALIVGIDNAIDSDLVQESSQSQIPDAVEIEHYVLDDVSQTSVISHDQATEDHIVLPDSPIPSTSQMSQPFITTIPSARKSPARSNTRTGLKNSVIEHKYKDRPVRATEKHNIEMQILKEQLREAKAKADLAELILKEKQNSTVNTAGLYPYHYTPEHVIEEGDPVRRLDFCRFMLNADLENPAFLKHILWTDESKFDKDGITNYHNAHYWAPKENRNPNKKRPKGSQRRFSLNVWMGKILNHLIGPHFLPDNLNGEDYENFLRNDLPELLEDLPLSLNDNNMWYQHDGCPAHYRRSVREWLDTNYPNKWIGRGGPIPWPARSPDLTPMDFYLWGHMKCLVYNEPHPISSVDVLRQKIIDAYSIRGTTGISLCQSNSKRSRKTL
ncbi:hypothetical protein B5X24_HaOG213992 [Helicoverpa armigera]|nr:hypothetical protein B5X24_HaOG213992 [Helicoverpa armigera]